MRSFSLSRKLQQNPLVKEAESACAASPNNGETIALDRQGTQQQRSESPTVTPPGVRVNIRYINPPKVLPQKKRMPPMAYIPSISKTLGDTGVRRHSSRSKDYVRSWIKIGSVVCLYTPVSPCVLEMQGIYTDTTLIRRGTQREQRIRQIELSSLNRCYSSGAVQNQTKNRSFERWRGVLLRYKSSQRPLQSELQEESVQ